MATFTEVNKYLSELPIGTYKLIDIVKKIQSISSKKHRTQQFLAQQLVDPSYRIRCSALNLKDIWVDISYQRSLKLKKIFDHLQLLDENQNAVGFSELLAGTVEFAIRPNGQVYVWDGFRRCMIALLNGIDCIPSNDTIHPTDWSDKRCQQKEAWAFTQVNSKMESMKQEELFKSGVAQDDKFYLNIKEVMFDCELDTLGVHPGKRKLGAYVEFQKLVVSQPFSDVTVTQSSNSFVVDASKMIQEVWPEEEVSGFMLGGVSHYLFKNEVDGNNGNEYYQPIHMIKEKLRLYVKESSGTQSKCTKDRLHSVPWQSVAWRFCKNVMGMSSINASKFIGMNDDQAEMLNASGK